MNEQLDHVARQREVIDSVLDLVRSVALSVSFSGETDSPFADSLAAALSSTAAQANDGVTRSVNLVLTTRRPSRDTNRSDTADVVIDVTDPEWPVIRRVAELLPFSDAERRRETQAFFAVRAATWEVKFGDDLPAYAAAVVESGIPLGATVADVGCGTGRALPALRDAVGPGGSVLGFDLTAQMLAAVRNHGRDEPAHLVQADAERLPLADRSLDAAFAAGLLPHTTSADAALLELARVVRPGGLLVLFHPSGREQLARRHGRSVRPEDTLSHAPLERSLTASGWRLDQYDDAPQRFFARAVRQD